MGVDLDQQIIEILKGKITEKKLQEFIDMIKDNHRLYLYSKIDEMLSSGEIIFSSEEVKVFKRFWWENY